jgi:hypothetical protein
LLTIVAHKLHQILVSCLLVVHQRHFQACWFFNVVCYPVFAHGHVNCGSGVNIPLSRIHIYSHCGRVILTGQTTRHNDSKEFMISWCTDICELCSWLHLSHVCASMEWNLSNLSPNKYLNRPGHPVSPLSSMHN